MQCALVGSRYFAATVFEALRKEECLQFSRLTSSPAGSLGLLRRQPNLKMDLMLGTQHDDQ